MRQITKLVRSQGCLRVSEPQLPGAVCVEAQKARRPAKCCVEVPEDVASSKWWEATWCLPSGSTTEQGQPQTGPGPGLFLHQLVWKGVQGGQHALHACFALQQLWVAALKEVTAWNQERSTCLSAHLPLLGRYKALAVAGEGCEKREKGIHASSPSKVKSSEAL